MKKILLSSLAVFFSALLLAQSPDAAVISIPMDDVYAAGSPVDVKIEFKNVGTASFNGLTLNWSADGGATVHSYPLNGFSFGVGSQFTIIHSTKITFANPGAYTELKAWTSNPGGSVDVNTSNDTLVKNIFVNNGLTTTRRVLVEEFTTAPCGFCPDGAIVLENILFSNPNVIAVGIHAGFGTDAMTIPAHSALANAFTSGAPTATVDRIKFAGQSNVAISRSIWASQVNYRQGINTPVDININGTYNALNRTATVTVSADFVDFALPGDIRLGLYVVEDSVSQVGSGYNQTNYYHSGSYGTNHPYYGAGNPIIGYTHRHVGRATYPANDPWGDTTVIPSAPQMGASYSKTYTIPISSNWDEDQIHFVAFATYHSSNTGEREIINAGEVKMNQMTTGLENVQQQLSFDYFPNPAMNQLNVEIKNEWVGQTRLLLKDISGKLLLDEKLGNVLNVLDISQFESGLYFLELIYGNERSTKKVIIK